MKENKHRIFLFLLSCITVFFVYLNLVLNPPVSNAQLNNIGPYDSCSKLHITFSENPSCPSGVATIGSYSMTVTVSSNDGKGHSFGYRTWNNFCTGSATSGSCVSNTIYNSGTAGTTHTFTYNRSPIYGSNCGIYQDDFEVTSVDGNSGCHYGNGSGAPGGAGICHTGHQCQYSNFGTCAGLPPSQSMCTNAPCGTAPANNFPYTIYSNCPTCACHDNCCGLNPTPTPTPTPTDTPTPTPNPNGQCPCFIKGNVYIDANTNGYYDDIPGGDPAYTTSPQPFLHLTGNGKNITLAAGTNGIPAGNYQFTALPAGTYNISLVSPPSGYTNLYPANGGPLTVTVGPNCGVAPGVHDAHCDSQQNINFLNFGFIPLQSISGIIYNDNSGDGKYSSPDTPYSGNISLTIKQGSTVITTMNQAGPSYNTGAILSPGTYTVEYNGPPGGYYMGYPLNGSVPPSFTVTVGPSCSIQSNDMTCTNGDVRNLDFGITNTASWTQSTCGDVRIDMGIINHIPSAPNCNSNSGAYMIQQNNSICSAPGIAFSGNKDPDFGLNGGKASVPNWIIGDSSFKEVFKPSIPTVIRTSYGYVNATSKQSGVTPTDIVANSICNPGKCTLSPGLSHGLYQITGYDLHLQGYTFKGNKNYVFLVGNGNLYIEGDIFVSPGSTVTFAVQRNIIVSPGVSTLEGFYSADKSVTVQSQANCTGNQPDSQLAVNGSVIVNAGLTGGSFMNNRNLCSSNTTCPSVSFALRPDLLLNAPAFIEHTQHFWKEIAPGSMPTPTPTP